MLDRLKEGLQGALRKLLGASVVDEAAVKEFVRDLQRTLLQADVNVRMVLDLTSRIERRALAEAPPPGLARKDHIVKILYDELSGILGTEGSLELPPDRLNVLLLVGIQGSGKTTVTAKLARYLQRRGYRVGVVGADTFRPGALTQLQMLCQPHGIEVYGEAESRDSPGVARKGLAHFRAHGRNVVIVDTAGRHKEEKGLIEEMKAISAVATPDLRLLVVDGTIGQQCYAQAAAFHAAAPVGGIIVTKLDGAAKGGGALAAAAATGARILFIGTGERIDDLELFAPARFVGRLLGLGDIKALLERARELEVDADEKKVQRIMAGKMTINDLYEQLEQVKKMGSLRKIVELIPGFSSVVKGDELEQLEGRLQVWKAVIQSMTKREREDPELLNASRIRRVARGSGTHEREVKEMLGRYRQAKVIMKQAKGRQFRQLLKRFGA
jgi:signal recognition particle subunit SRP54